MADRTLTVNGQPFTFNRDRFAGVRTMTVTAGTVPLTDDTTSIQVTVAGYAVNSGIYTTSTPVTGNSTWSQQGGASTITPSNFNETDGYSYLVEDQSDSDPQILLNTGAGFTDRPWEAVMPSSPQYKVTITGLPLTETVTVDRTAQVIDSDRKGESRPLLSKVVGGAAAAYSLRDLNDKQGNNKVVRVRRGSNNVESDFTASGVSSGALLDFVTTPQIGWNAQPTFSNAAGTGSVTSQSSTATTATVSFTGEASLIRETSKPNHVLGSSGDQVIFNISVSGLDSAGTLRLRTSGTNTSVGSATNINNGDNQDITINLSGSAGYLAMTFVASSGGTITFNSIKVLPKSGFVETWYDQSGNSEDAVQATAGSQPKIVIAGSLVTGGIDFLDGTETFLETTNSDICNVPQLSFFTVLTPHIASSQLAAFSCGATVGNSTSYGGWEMNLNGYGDLASFQTQSKGNSLVTSTQTGVTSSEALLSFVSTFPNASISRDGGTVTTSSSMVSPNQTSAGTRKFRIGCKFTFRAANFYTQPINEIIVYTSNQTANRPAIEANINNQYDIY